MRRSKDRMPTTGGTIRRYVPPVRRYVRAKKMIMIQSGSPAVECGWNRKPHSPAKPCDEIEIEN